MKTIFVILISFAYPMLTFSQSINEQRVKTDIDNITVFLNGAEIDRNININLLEGQNRIIFYGLSPNIDQSSIRVYSDTDIAILAMSSKKTYINAEKDNPQVRKIKDSIELLQDKIIELKNLKDAFNTEKEMLLKNQQFVSNEKTITLTQLEQAAGFYRKRINEINNENSAIDKQLLKLELVFSRYQNELNEINRLNNHLRSEIAVLVETKTAQKALIGIKYLVNDAGWTPSYDLKAANTAQPITFIYRAKVYNNTQIDWNNAKLVLSSADPSQSATQPTINTWYLNYNDYYDNDYGIVNSKKEGYMQNRVMGNLELQQISDDFMAEEERYTEVEVSALSAEFDISKRYTIPADDKPYLVDISESVLNASFQHYSVAKMDRDAFLLARISGWEDLSLIDGSVNVYYDGTYIGQSYLSTRNISDTLAISLGRDKKVLVTRSKLKDYSSTQMMGTKRKEVHAYQIAIKNNSKAPINIELKDQLPISQNSEIEVDIIEISGAKHNLTTGILTWNTLINPGETKKFDLHFAIKYPKNREVKVQNEPSVKQNMRMF